MLVNFCLLGLKILNGNEILTIKSHKPVIYVRKMTGNNPNIDLVNINAHTKFGQILTISSQEFEPVDPNFDICQGP